MMPKHSEKLLFVDDEQNVLSAFRRQFHRRYSVFTACGGDEALNCIQEKGPFAVVVSDFKMPGMDGVKLLGQVRKINPDSVRVMLTGQADLNDAVGAVNEGNIFRFLTKPCPYETLSTALEDCLAQHGLITAERVLLKDTLKGSIQLLIDILSMVNPVAFGHASQAREYVKQMCDLLGIEDMWMIEIATMLSQIGCITLPPSILENRFRGDELTTQEQELFERHPQIGRELISRIPRLGPIADMIAGQHNAFDSKKPQTQVGSSDAVTMGAQILRTALDFAALELRGLPKRKALEDLRGREGAYDPQVLNTFEQVLGIVSDYEIRQVTVDQLRLEMVLEEDVTASTGILIVSKGQTIAPIILERLKNFSRSIGIQEPLTVRVPRARRSTRERSVSPSTPPKTTKSQRA